MGVPTKFGPRYTDSFKIDWLFTAANILLVFLLIHINKGDGGKAAASEFKKRRKCKYSYSPGNEGR